VLSFLKRLTKKLMAGNKKEATSVFSKIEKTNNLDFLNTEPEVEKSDNVEEIESDKNEDDNGVFEIVIRLKDKEHILYSPKILLNEYNPTILALFGTFTKYVLQELIDPVEKTTVIELGRKTLPEQDFKIDLTQGIVLKRVTKQPWMERSEEETKKVFDENVLNAFREYKASLHNLHKNIVIHQQQSIQQQQQQSQQRNQRKNDSRYEGINRSEINDFD
jgi:hypothetical protein